MEHSALGFPQGIQLVQMTDREGDFFEFFDKAIEREPNYVIRAVQNRVTDSNGQLLFDLVHQEPAASQFKVNIPRDTRRNLNAKELTLEIRFLQSNIRVPQQLEKKFGKDGSIAIYIIQTKEIDPLPDIEPIEWFLITNLAITTADEAMENRTISLYFKKWL